MDIRHTQRALRTMEDLLSLQNQRARERRQAANEGLEQFVRVQEVKAKLTIQAVTEPRTSTFETRA